MDHRAQRTRMEEVAEAIFWNVRRSEGGGGEGEGEGG